ncbi:HNH endonuclease signature motif containing protein, partial [Mycolicibacterium brumae]
AAVTDPVVTIAGPGAPSGGPVTPAVREAGEDPTATDPAGLPTPDVPAALTGWAVTAGGSMVPMSDFLRMASHALHYLVIFDGRGRPLWLGRTKRLASADQRLVLFARDKGCTKPGCTRSAYRCQAHHLTPYGRGREGRTDIDDLGLACGGDNTMADTQNWTTHLNPDGRIEWTPPAHLDHGQPRVNPHHQPADMLAHFHKRFRHQHPPGTDPPQGSKS